MGKRKTFPKVISCILVLVMLFTLAPGNLIHAFANEGGESAQRFTYVKLHFLNDKGYTTPAINCWDGSASDVEVTADGQVDIVAWGSKQHKMFTEEDDYYYATLKAVGSSGNITGIQIIDAPAEQSTFIQLDNTAMEAINDCKHSEGEEPTDLYCAYGKIYTNKVEGIGYTSPIVNEDGSVTIVYDMNEETAPFKDLTELNLMGTITDWNTGKPMKLEDGKFSITINKPQAAEGDIVVTPGTYQYKFKSGSNWFADPANKEVSDGNSVVHVPGMVVSGQSTAGSGSFDYSANLQTADGSTGTITAWDVSTNADSVVAPTGLSIAMDEADHTKAVLTADDTAADGYYYVIVTYEAGGKEKKQAVKYYHTSRAILYEYTYKEDSKYKGKADFYSWYNSPETTGYKFISGSDNSVGTAYVPLDKNVSSFGYIVRSYGEWGENDREFTDRTLTVNEGERYTKVRGGEGIQNPYVLSTGKTGYDNGIVFRYRDNTLFYQGKMNTLKSVKVKVMVKAPGDATYTAYEMSYDDKNELYTYNLSNDTAKLSDGNYQFYYEVNGKAVADLYYTAGSTETVDGVKAAVIPYANYEYTISTDVTPENGVNSDQNPVVSLKVTREAGEETIDALAQGEIKEIKADSSKLGVTERAVISPVTGKATLYVKEGLPAGTYNVPITVVDIYGQEHTANAVVKVVAASKSLQDWDESIIYFLLTDRFYDGDTKNNVSSKGVPVDKSIREDYHGGDFAGLTAKLDYIQELGVNTIWITPIVDNIESFDSDETKTSVGGYAGYWACDFTKIDEHLGTTEEFDKLLDEAHKRNIKVMLDIVVNHAGYDKNGSAKDWSDETDSPFAGMIRPEAQAGSDSLTQWMGDLPDFMTEKQEVRSKLIAWQKAWATHTTAAGNSVDYFRVDTVKHVDHETWNQLKSEIAEANPNFKMIGEYYGASVTNTGDYLGNGEMDSLLDFDFKSQAGNFVNGKIDSTETALESRNATLNNAITMGQFLSSHDEIGFLESVGKDTAKMKLAAALEMTAKGQPIIYYGEEINLTGNTTYGSDENNRYDMQFDNLTDEQTAMLTHYKKLIAARNTKTAVFAKGTRTKIAGGDSEGYLVFKRSYGSDFAYVGLNTTATSQDATFKVSENVSTVKDLYSGKSYAVNSGSVTVTIPANAEGGTVILVGGATVSGGGSSSVTTPAKKENVTTEKLPDGSVVETKTETVDGGEKTTVTTKDESGNVTSVVEKTEITDVADDVQASVTVTTNAEGEKSSEAEVIQEGDKTKSGIKTTVDAKLVAKLTVVSGEKNTVVTQQVTKEDGTVAYTLQINASDLKANEKLVIVKKDPKTGEYILCNAKNYKVSKDGDLNITIKDKGNYVLLNKEDSKAVIKKIVKTIKVKNSSKTVKKGKSSTVTMSKGLDKRNVAKISYTSTDKSVATVNKKGKVLAKKKGRATIKVKVTLKNGTTKTVTMKVKVK